MAALDNIKTNFKHKSYINISKKYLVSHIYMYYISLQFQFV